MDSNLPDIVLRPGGGRRVRVLFSYSPQNDDELQLQVNDEIDFLAEVEDGWWRGKLGNKIGVFPSNFVCEVNAEESCPSEGELSAPLSSPDSAMIVDDAPVLPPKPVKETCRVLFAYEAANDDELTLKKDDIITIITKEVEDKGWWKGEIRGKIGLFPDNFVELISPPEDIVQTQQKKPDRPSKTFDKIDTKVPLISAPGFQKILQDNTNQKDQEEKLAGLKNEGPFLKKNVQNLEKNKPESPGTKFGDKGLNLFQSKTESTASHRKSLEIKSIDQNQSQQPSPPTIVAKKPVLPPPLSNKPKPASGKPGQVKRLSEEINDLFESAANKTAVTASKRLSGDIHDLVDGGINSKMGSAGGQSPGGVKEDFDLDIVERSDMLTHITSSRPRPPGRRLPSRDVKENEGHSPLTNGSVDTSDKEKSQKEREWEKHKPPWVNELKLNLKSNKTSPSESKFDKKSAQSGQVKSPAQSPVDGSGSVEGPNVNVTVRQFSPQSAGSRVQSMFETGTKVSELSSKFSSVDKSRPMTSVSPPKTSENAWNSVGDTPPPSEDMVQISRKEFVELKSKVESLEKILLELTSRFREEVDKRKLLEKELNKLTDLVTQV